MTVNKLVSKFDIKNLSKKTRTEIEKIKGSPLNDDRQISFLFIRTIPSKERKKIVNKIFQKGKLIKKIECYESNSIYNNKLINFNIAGFVCYFCLWTKKCIIEF